MKYYLSFLKFLLLVTILFGCSSEGKIQYSSNQSELLIHTETSDYMFAPKFTVLYRETDPKMAFRPAGVKEVNYNMPTWMAYQDKKADLEKTERRHSDYGDGFDAGVLAGKTDQRTLSIFNGARDIEIEANKITQQSDTIFWHFPEHDMFNFEAFIVPGVDNTPLLQFNLTPKKEGYYSVGYTGAPSYAIEDVNEIWQPMVWQEKRFPKKSILTLAFRAPLPTCLVDDGKSTVAVLAAPEEFPFNPLPNKTNNRFGISVRNKNGDAQPLLFAPVLGALGSHMKAGQPFSFRAYLIANAQPLTYTYEKLARTYYGFKDFRRNELISLNKTLENMVDYSKTDFAWFVDSLKGFAYSTDVPGAVKNVSSLHPLEFSIAMDDSEMFEKRAYPLMEYMISREKFLFSMDSTQRNQSPSRALKGPIAPISELASLYNIFNGNNSFFLEMAKEEYGSSRIRNLDVVDKGETWINAMFLYNASGEEQYLIKAKQGADQYLKERVNKRQTDFSDPLAGGFFFWRAFTSRWVELLELYELTNEKRYLDAAVDGARHYALFTWMCPKVPDSKILVNKGGKAPMYWYLKSKGHKQMYYPEEEVEAWRLSEMGLTSESSGTSGGHRGIFMSNLAPCMLRIGEYANDDFLKEIAKSAIIGRYRNFPGYHINTERTTAYEKEDYPLHKHKELSVNSFHYNHILPMASMVLDYLVTDVWARSDGQIQFPSDYIEGYAYMQNKFYGHKKGSFYKHKDVQLWMPKNLLEIDNIELNYVAARKGNTLFIALSNQSNEEQEANITFNPALVALSKNSKYTMWHNNKLKNGKHGVNKSINTSVPAGGMVAYMIEDVTLSVNMQEAIVTQPKPLENTYLNIDFGNAKAMAFTLGKYDRRAYVYLGDDDNKFSSVTLTYKDERGHEVSLTDDNYPYEFTVEIEDKLSFYLSGVSPSGGKTKSKALTLGK